MKHKSKYLIGTAVSILTTTGAVLAASDTATQATDTSIQAQRDALAASTDGAGFGPQSPRDIDCQTIAPSNASGRFDTLGIV